MIIKQPYIYVGDCTDEERELFVDLLMSEDHNNGYAFRYFVLGDVKSAAYPKLEQYFLDQGYKANDLIIIHNCW